MKKKKRNGKPKQSLRVFLCVCVNRPALGLLTILHNENHHPLNNQLSKPPSNLLPLNYMFSRSQLPPFSLQKGSNR